MNKWIRWLIFLSAVMLLFGAELAFLPGTMHDTLFIPLFEATQDGSLAAFDVAQTDFLYWLYGITGGVMMGWFALVIWLVHVPFRRSERWAWSALAAAVVIWFVPDTYASLVNGATLNAVFNAVSLVGFGLPLLATYRHFQHDERAAFSGKAAPSRG